MAILQGTGGSGAVLCGFFLKFLVEQKHGEIVYGKGMLRGAILGHHRDPAFVAVQCIWDEELDMVVLAGPVLSRLTVEISCHETFLLRCCNTQCVCPKSYSLMALEVGNIPSKGSGSSAAFSQVSIDLSSLQDQTCPLSLLQKHFLVWRKPWGWYL